MWARVKEMTKNGKQKWRVGDLLADERCSPALTKDPRRESGSTGRKIGTVRMKRRRRRWPK